MKFCKLNVTRHILMPTCYHMAMFKEGKHLDKVC